MTPILKVLTEYCDIYVDDIRIKEKAQTDPALYAWEMWRYLRVAIPLFTTPPEMKGYLMGTKDNPKLIEPEFDTTLYTVEQGTVQSITIQTDKMGYGVCSCRIKYIDKANNVIMLPRYCTYNKLNGTVIVYASEDLPLSTGDILDLDFYKDGYFVEDLDSDIMSILALAFRLVWNERFNTDWLSDVSKVEDKSFTEQNRANKKRADTERSKALYEQLSVAMRRYEQNKYYLQVVGRKLRI